MPHKACLLASHREELGRRDLVGEKEVKTTDLKGTMEKVRAPGQWPGLFLLREPGLLREKAAFPMRTPW